ncbi:YncE family protein [Saccharopolyspora sp. SCSIO 74807]|uniref:YncE family protein n=1 Tax=Saccharopolyspora sp. SCSIO 74807 TaxID=3118084 RepID=UPI0030CC6BD6
MRKPALLLFAIATALTGCAAPPAPPPPPPPAAPQPLPPPAEPEQAPAQTAAAGDLSLPAGAPEGAVVEPGSRTLVVALREPDRLAMVDLDTRRVDVVPAPGAARHLVTGRPGEVLVLGENTGRVARVAVPSGQVLGEVPVGPQPHDAAQVGETVFVSNEMGGSVGVVRDGRMVRELPGLAQPGGLTATGGRIAAVDVRGNRLHVFDASTLREVAVLPAGLGPSHVRPIGEGRVAVADTRGHAVLTFSITGRPRQLGAAPLPGRAYGLATDPARGRAYATSANTNQLAVLDIRPDGTPAAPRLLPAVQQPNDVAVDPRNGDVWVVGTARAELQVLPAARLSG